NYKKFKLLTYLFWAIFIATIGAGYPKTALAETGWGKVSTLESDYIKVLEPTPYGLLAGEYDSRTLLDPPPANAVFLSKDFGQTWNNIGLDKRAILDLKYYDGKIYAATYYTVNYSRGLFLSEDFGENWTNIGPNVSPTKIDRNSNTIFLGTNSYGIYISTDEGQTWTKSLGESGTQWKIYGLQSSEEVTFTATVNKFYRTENNGETWQQIEFFDGKTIASICINGDIVFAGATGTSGLFRSRDKGLTWEKVLGFGNYSVDKIIFFKGSYYAGRYNPGTEKYSVFVSHDEGENWSDIGLNLETINKVISLAVLVSEPSHLFSAISTKGVHKYQIPAHTPAESPFLNIPWEYQNENELMDTITSYFDHSYPLLGYSYFSEPENESDSTLNFLGYKNIQPHIYYSSHSGTDFGLPYGTDILAPASGYATYYYCKDCGNSIKIDHGNGYQTTYMHLQDDNLVTKNDKIWMNNNDIIGKVGLTGRTTGPHLHFEVTKDKDMDGVFTNDFPMGRTDPFGWHTKDKNDPWRNFSWEDTLGNHSGSSSLYLWNIQNRKISGVISGDTNPESDKNLTLDNINVEFENPQNFFTSKILTYIHPVLDSYNYKLQYIKNTSFILEAFDQIGNEIKHFENPISISINIDFNSLQNINPENISLYYWNEIVKIWEKIPSIYNQQNNTIEASVNHLSWFSIFGEKIDYQPPETGIIVSGSQNDLWFIEYPMVELLPNDENVNGVGFTIYSIDDGDFWHNYSQPFYVEKEGITNLIYKSQDLNENMESEKNIVLHINTSGAKTEKIKVLDGNFKVSF
ncbi:peptidoglycan DD-metalloendopeptidase family protein, partial [Patescibacteria group bacterium]|nr:peptidoglycan DD-metalloendopeptidase family protein [Patescibacteria group bacterium]